jgi:Rrf2 family cysteine metabolism transcriptional repressor
MKISTRARYGTRAMLDLALHYEEGAVMVKDIAARQKISSRYLEQLLLTLKLAGLLRSSRGSKGGFMLSRKPAQIRLMEIVEALDGSIAPVSCVDEPGFYPRAEFCATHDVWVEVKRAVSNVLNSITLQHLVIKFREKEASVNQSGLSEEDTIYAACGDR